MFINALASDLHLDVLDQDVTEPVQPTETRGTRHGHCGKLRAEVHAVNQITIAGDGAGNFLAEIGRTIEGLLNRFHREVSMSAINAAISLAFTRGRTIT